MTINFKLTDRVAIVTGSSRGIGKAIALAFADMGANVVVASRTVPDLEKTANEIRSKGRRALVVKTDVSIKQDIENMVAQAIKEFGTVDILVNNAAREIASPLMKFREDGWDKTFDIDVKAYYLCAQAAGKVMMEHKRGNIINIGSTASTMVDPYSGAYGAAKAAVVQLSRVLAGEMSYHSIRVNCICPGVTRTKMTEGIWTNPEVLKSYESNMPLKRIADPEDMVGAAVFLASDAASYITGATLFIDGGISLFGINPNLTGMMLPPEYRLG